MTSARIISLALVLLSAFTHALMSFLIKRSGDKQIFSWLYNFCTLLIFFPVPVYYAVTEPEVFGAIPITILLVGMLHYAYLYTFARALHDGDLSLVYPIIRSAPAFVLVAGVLILHEQVSVLGASGVLLTVLGVYVLCVRGSGLRSAFSPMKDAIRNESTRFALLTALATTGFSLADKVLVASVPPALYTYLLHLMVTLYMTPQIVVSKPRAALWEEVRAQLRSLFACGFLDPFGYFLVLAAFRVDKVSYVLGMRQVSIIIAVMMGGLLLKESGMRQRLIASAIIFLGILCISFAK
ncbi:MAG: EamA family transporter [Bdellovibrionota bacterium]